MSEQVEIYCRLCADLKPTLQLLALNDDVAINADISTKIMWINVDISNSNLPSSVCFPCFDLLERTWTFLHQVRNAQAKLLSLTKTDDGNRVFELTDAGKPLDVDWEEFQRIKGENFSTKMEDSKVLTYSHIKREQNSDNDLLTTTQKDNSYSSEDSTTDSSTDRESEIEQKIVANRRKVLSKRKLRLEKLKDKPINVSSLNISWDSCTCQCASCNQQFKNIASLQQHSMKMHLSCCTFKCLDCAKVFSGFIQFVVHAKVHRKLLKYSCEYCNKQYTTAALVKQHQSRIHKNVLRTICKNCGSRFKTQQLLQDHIELYGKDYKNRTEELKRLNYKCEICNKEFRSSHTLDRHRKVHMERSRDFVCHLCGKMFYSKRDLSGHMIIHTDLKPYKCEMCPRAFRVKANLRSHVTCHSGAKPFVCKQCGRTFRTNTQLKSHSLTHTDLKPYICKDCGKSFRLKQTLLVHLRQHTGVKPYHCEYCQRDFTNDSNFIKHNKRKHSNVKVDNNTITKSMMEDKYKRLE